MTSAPPAGRRGLRTAVGVVGGLGATSMALSSGFIWAYQASEAPSLWSNPYVPRVFVAAFVAWWGYLVAHYAVTGRFIDVDEGGAEPAASGRTAGGLRAAVAEGMPDRRVDQVALVAGAAVLVSGMVVGTVAIRAQDHLFTNVGGVLFLGGYVIAHYGATQRLL